MHKCPVFQVAGLIGKKWTIVLLQEIEKNGSKGFNHILKRVERISPKILSIRLNELKQEGLIKKKTIKSIPVTTQYKITAKGRDLQKIIESLKLWNIRHSDMGLKCNNKDCVRCPMY